MATTYPLLFNGSAGAAVVTLQGALNDYTVSLTTKLEPDGVFGRLTEGAVRLFQRENSCAIDGIAGNETWGALTQKHGRPFFSGRGGGGGAGGGSGGDGGDDSGRGGGDPGGGGNGGGDGGGSGGGVVGWPVQHTQDDCGYFSHYCLAEANKRKSLNISVTAQQIIDARTAYLTARGINHGGHRYLAPDDASDFLEYLGVTGFRRVMAEAKFKSSVDTNTGIQFLDQSLGQTGLTIVLNKWRKSYGLKHWIAVMASEATPSGGAFFVYDSSCHIPRSVLGDKNSTTTAIWVDAFHLVNFLKTCWVGSIITST